MKAERITFPQAFEDAPWPSLRAEMVFCRDFEPVETRLEIILETGIVSGSKTDAKQSLLQNQ